jgi:hypothetical protein
VKHLVIKDVLAADNPAKQMELDFVFVDGEPIDAEETHDVTYLDLLGGVVLVFKCQLFKKYDQIEIFLFLDLGPVQVRFLL